MKAQSWALYVMLHCECSCPLTQPGHSMPHYHWLISVSHHFRHSL